MNNNKKQSLSRESSDLQEAKFPVRIFNNKNDKIGKEKIFSSFQDLVTYLDIPFKPTQPKLAQLFKTKDTVNAAIFGITDGTGKCKENILTRNALAIDIDGVNLSEQVTSYEQLSSLLIDFEYDFYLYTTSSSTLSSPKFRLIVPFSIQVSASRYESIITNFIKHCINTNLFEVDSLCNHASQIMYVPFVPSKDYKKYSFYKINGVLLNPEEFIDKEVDTISDIELAANHLPLPDVTTDRVKEVLGGYSSADISYEEWRDVVFALHHQYQGSKEGLDILLEWSLKEDTKRTKESIISGCKTHYKNAKTEDKKRPLTFATIIARVNELEDSTLQAVIDKKIDKLNSGSSANDIKDLMKCLYNRFGHDNFNIGIYLNKIKSQTNETLSNLKEMFKSVSSEIGDKNLLEKNKDLMEGLYPFNESLPKTVLKYKKKRLQQSIENFELILKSYGFIIRYNDISRETEILNDRVNLTGDKKSIGFDAQLRNVCLLNDFDKDKNIKNCINWCIAKNRFNPIANWIESKKWDGTNRLDNVFKTIVTNNYPDKFKNLLIKKWLLSAVAAAYKTDFRSKGVLIFQSNQSKGKTTWFETLLPLELRDYFLEGVSHNPDDKDSNITINSAWIAELGEIESTMRKDTAKIKASITQKKVKIRNPYDHWFTTYHKRTVLCGSVNKTEFLNDMTGNTRFWVIPILKADYEALSTIDMQQVFAEIYENLYLKDEQWWLNEKEEIELERYNMKFLEKSFFVDLFLSDEFFDLSKEAINKTKKFSHINPQTKAEEELKSHNLEWMNANDICSHILKKAREKDITGLPFTITKINKNEISEIVKKFDFPFSSKHSKYLLLKSENKLYDNEDPNGGASGSKIDTSSIEENSSNPQPQNNDANISNINPLEPKSNELNYEVQDRAILSTTISNWDKSIIYGIDIETTGLNPSNSRVALLQIYNPAIDKIFIYKLYDEPLTNEEKQILSEIRFVAHNASFERSFMPYLKNLDCSMIAYHAATSDKCCGLSDLSLETGITYNNKKLMQTSDWSGELTDEQLEYAAKDAKATYLLWEKYKDNNKPVYDRMYKASFIIDDYSKRGLPIDIEAFRKLKLDTENKKEELLQKLIDLGFEEIITPARNIRTKKELMAKVTPDVMKIVEEVRSTNALLNNMISGVEENIINDRLPINTLICGTETGRLATVKPNVQNFPRSGFRHIFKARDGYRFIRADFSGQELRMVAAMSNEKVLIEAFNAGKDPHAIMAARLNNMPFKEFMEKPLDWQKSERQKAKAANFGFLYGMGAKRFIDNAKDNYNVVLTEEEATTIKTKFWSTYSFLKRWSDKERADCRARGYALTKGGRKRFFEDMDKAYCEMINTAVQGSCGEVLLETLIALPEYLKGYLVNTVHDELVFEVPIELIQDEAKYTEIKNHITGAMIAGVRKVEPRYPTLNITEIKDTDRL